MNVIRPRLVAANVLVGAAYSAIYIRCYIYFLNYYFAYAGYAFYPRPTVFLMQSVAIAIAPLFIYRGYRSLSSAIAVFVYALLYVPIVLTFALASSRSTGEITEIQLVFLIAMVLLFAIDVLRVGSPIFLRLRLNLAAAVLALTLLTSLCIAIVYRSNLQFVSFAAVYEQRFANEALGAGLVTRYASVWLKSVMIPICLAFGIVRRRWTYFAAGTIGCIVIYMATAAKSVILLPVVYVALAALFARGRLTHIYVWVTGGLTAMIAALLLIARGATGTGWIVSSLVLQRTVGNGGQIATMYYDYFQFHPQTEYSHVAPLRVITPRYPYGTLGVGQVIGQYYFAPDMNANASFWATDGFAAMGLPGVLVATLACASLLVLLNMVTRDHDPLFAVLCFIPFIISLLNASIFESFWSGGAFFLLAFFVLNGVVRAHESSAKAVSIA